MIARLDKMEGNIIGQGRDLRGEIQAVRDEVQLNSLNSLNLGVKIDKVHSEVTAIGTKVGENKGDHGNGW